MEPREILINLAILYDGNHQKICEAIRKNEMPEDVYKERKIKSKALTYFDNEYPEEFRHCTDAPLVLFYYGDISLIKDYTKHLTVVGTRNPGEYGINITKELVKEAVKSGLTIVSGLALGIDRVAHETAIKEGGKTIAVLGCGIDYCYPFENYDIYEEIKKNHLIISEYPNAVISPYGSFAYRNRILAMLSKTTLITEAYERSGTSITARFALNYDKDVCCVPFRAGENSLCNRLIASGAFLIENWEDLKIVMGIPDEKPIFEM